MPLVAARGLTFHVQVLGPASADRTVVMLHGLFVGTLASWYFSSAPRFAPEKRVFLYDLRGHGRSARPPTGYDVATMAGDLDALTADAPHPLDLVGHSFGALVALRFALDHPSRVRSLALVEAPLPPSSVRELDDFTSRSPSEMLAALPEDMRAVLAGGGRRASRLVEGLTFLASGTTLLDDLAREPDIDDATLATLSCPVRCIYGDRSSCRPVGDRLARTIPGARLDVIAGGHFLPFESPEALTARLEEHLDG